MPQANRVFDLLIAQQASAPKTDCLAAKVNGQWKTWSTRDVIEEAETLARGFIAYGLTPGERVAIISPNRPEWVIADFALQMAGLVSVPIYPTITAEDYAFIFGDSGTRLVLCGTQEITDKTRAAAGQMAAPPDIYGFDVTLEGAKPWTELLALGTKTDEMALATRADAVGRHDTYTIIYTSGTTGKPKGVVLSHHNLLSNIEGCAPVVPITQGDRALSFLPLCHVYERVVTGMYVRYATSIYYAESLEKVGDNLREVQPTIFTTVPRLLEKVYDKIEAKGRELKGIKRALFFWALDLGLRYEPGRDMGGWYNFQLGIANRLIFSKWREALGGRVEYIVSGGAALQPRLARIFRAARIAVMEGYGLTETCTVIAVNGKDEAACRVGTVGRVISNMEVRLAADGEIEVRGPSVFAGYYNRPDLTAEVFTPDGWFRTGDVGQFVEGDFLKITDRKKELFKTSGGKYIAPQAVENLLKESVVIEQCMVVGEGERYPAALIVPNFLALRDWARVKSLPLDGLTDEQILALPDVADKFSREVDRANQSLAQHEKIKRYALIPEAFSIEAGLITPTLKLRRKAIMTRYSPQISALYAV